MPPVSSPPAAAPLRLSSRERQALEMFAGGVRDREAAESMGLSVGTLRVYRRRVEAKLGVRGPMRCALVAWRLGLLDLEALADGVLAARDAAREG